MTHLCYNIDMTTKYKYHILSGLAVIGLGVSLYLTIMHFRGVAVPCSVTHGCEAVMNSKYAKLVGIPLPVLGLLYFGAALTLSLISIKKVQARIIASIVYGLGALAALAFLGLQFFVIKKVCQYCFVTDVTSVIIFLLDLNTTASLPAQNKATPAI